MNRMRKFAAALLGLSLMSASAGAQTWTAVTAAAVNEDGVPFWDKTSNDGSHCNIGYVVFGILNPACSNGDASSGRWYGGTGALVSATASYVDPGIPFTFAAGTWKFDLLGGFRGSVLGWSPSDAEYMGVTNGSTSNKWYADGSYTVTYATSFSLAMPGYVPLTEILSSNPVIGGKPQFALFSTIDRSPVVFSGVLAYNIGDSYVIGFEDYRDGDRDFNDVVVVAHAVSTVPEPASIALLATGLVGLAGVARSRRRAK